MVEQHIHSGTDSPQLKASEALINAPQSAMTTANASGLSSGGAAVLSNGDSAVIENMRTRINELETKLRAIGLIL
jgi:hypothetical protein